MTVKEILETYLKENGYDGLYNNYGLQNDDGEECGCFCFLEKYFCLCDDISPDCKPGIKLPDPSEEGMFMVGPSESTTFLEKKK